MILQLLIWLYSTSCRTLTSSSVSYLFRQSITSFAQLSLICHFIQSTQLRASSHPRFFLVGNNHLLWYCVFPFILKRSPIQFRVIRFGLPCFLNYISCQLTEGLGFCIALYCYFKAGDPGHHTGPYPILSKNS